LSTRAWDRELETANSAPFNYLGVALMAIAGFLLFLASRKLVWGRDESLISASVWMLAVAPYLLYLVGRRIAASAALRAFNFEGADFLAIWTCSLLIFVIARWTGFGDLFEDPIYDTFVPGPTRYGLLSTIYIALGFAVVLLARLLVSGKAKTMASSVQRTASYIVGVVLFLCSIFLIAA